MHPDFLADDIAAVDLVAFMREALHEAEIAGQAGESPIGAVIVIDGQIVARGYNQRKQCQSQIMHAELNALLAGGVALWEHYERAILFSSVEPCPMCLGATVMADVPHIIFAARDALVHSGQTVATNSYVRRHIRSYHGGLLEQESLAIIERYDPKLLRYITAGRAQE